MLRHKVAPSAVLGASLLLLAGCGGVGSKHDFIDVEKAIPSTALVLMDWTSGSGFLLDRNERLLVTSQYCLANKTECEVAFPVIENGKALARKEPLLQKVTRIKARLVGTDPTRDIAVLQLESVPDGVPELKLAAEGSTANASVHLLGASARASNLFAYTSTTVKSVGPRDVSIDKVKVKARMLELNQEGKLAKDLSGGPVLNDADEVVGILAGTPCQKDGLLAIDVADARVGIARGYRGLGALAFDQGKYQESIDYCTKALAICPTDALAYNERGVAYALLDEHDKAIENYTAAIKQNPNLARAYRNRASAYASKGEFKSALPDCEMALKLDDNYVRAYETRRLVYSKLNMKDKADHDEKIIAHLTRTEWTAVSSSGAADNSSAFRPMTGGRWGSMPTRAPVRIGYRC